MKEIQLDMQTSGLMGSFGMKRRFLILEDAVANAAYTKLKQAMDTYREHGNDRDQTVEIDFGPGCLSTIKINSIVGVTIVAQDAEEIELAIAAARREKTIKDRLKDEGLWEEDAPKAA